MLASSVRATEQPQDMAKQSYADWMAVCKGNLDAMLASGQAFIRGYQTVGTELIAFCQSRMKIGLETGQRLAECRSPDSAAEVQIEFAQTALKAYTEEFKTVGDLTAQVVTDAFAPLQMRASQSLTRAQENAAA